MPCVASQSHRRTQLRVVGEMARGVWVARRLRMQGRDPNNSTPAPAWRTVELRRTRADASAQSPPLPLSGGPSRTLTGRFKIAIVGAEPAVPGRSSSSTRTLLQLLHRERPWARPPAVLRQVCPLSLIEPSASATSPATLFAGCSAVRGNVAEGVGAGARDSRRCLKRPLHCALSVASSGSRCRTMKGAFRASGGYRELRRQLLRHISRTAEQAREERRWRSR